MSVVLSYMYISNKLRFIIMFFDKKKQLIDIIMGKEIDVNFKQFHAHFNITEHPFLCCRIRLKRQHS